MLYAAETHPRARRPYSIPQANGITTETAATHPPVGLQEKEVGLRLDAYSRGFTFNRRGRRRRMVHCSVVSGFLHSRAVGLGPQLAGKTRHHK